MSDTLIDLEAALNIEKLGYMLQLSPFGDDEASIQRVTDDEMTLFSFVPNEDHCFLEPLPDEEIFKTLDRDLKHMYSCDEVDAHSMLECAITYLRRNQ